MRALPETLPGHWSTPDGREMAQTYSTKTRDDLCNPSQTDYELANALYMESGPIVLQTAAKERMRWLSVQLAMAQARAAAAEEARDDLEERLRDLVMVDSEEWAIGGGPGFKERKEKAWARAREPFEP